MLKEWQFNILFFVGVGGAVFLLIGPEFGLHGVGDNPTALAGVGSILTYILTQRGIITKQEKHRRRQRRNEDEDHEAFSSPYDEERGDDK